MRCPPPLAPPRALSRRALRQALAAELQRRQDAERQARRERDRERERDDGAVHPDVLQAGEIGGLHRDQRPRRDVRDRQPGDRASRTEDDRLGEELAEQPHRGRRRARSERPAPPGAPMRAREAGWRRSRRPRAARSRRRRAEPGAASARRPAITSVSGMALNVSVSFVSRNAACSCVPIRRRSSSTCASVMPGFARPITVRNSPRRPFAVAALNVSLYTSGV